ncbi:MAG TPA: CheR family methyltransferase [Polyangiaceae bacterium]
MTGTDDAAHESLEAGESTPPAVALRFPVVGIGASAGGLEALEALTRALSPERIALVIVQHGAPGHASMLGEILARCTRIPVLPIGHDTVLEPSTIYVAPPGRDVRIEEGRLRLSTADGRAPSRAIDSFFRSLAGAGGPMAIGVVLSGSGTDGTLGLRAIKEEGGVTFAQEPSTASQPAMPQSAIDSGSADFVLSPAAIAVELVRLATHPYVGRAEARIDDLEGQGTIFEHLRAAYGVDFGLYKRSTIDRRIARRMALHKVDRLSDYVLLLSSDKHELRELYDDLLIGVTRFFRDAEPFEALKTVVFPRLVENRPADRPLRLWIAGCATGEEAYSIAITLLEFLGDSTSAYKIQIFATDVDDDALTRARTAVYPASIEMDVSPERLQRFFTRSDKGYQLTRQVRDLVVFARHNLGKDPPFSRVDLITCRNVLIYMQNALQRRVLRIFHYALNPGGFVVLGTSESVGESGELFTLLDRKLKVYSKRAIPVSAVFDVSFAHRGAHGADAGSVADPRPALSIAQVADRKVIEKYAPPGVIVDERLEVVQFRGHTGAYLDPAPGAATLNLAKLVRPELLVVLRSTVSKALVDGLQTSSPPVVVPGPDGERKVAIDVLPLPDAGGRKCLLVLFHHLSGDDHARIAVGAGEVASRPGEPSTRTEDLERALATTKEYLQSTIEELEAANEELQSSNEELQSSNEELQSSNEELETSKEELQSTNEELATVNDELQNRMGQLGIVNDDLQNVFFNTSAVIVIVGSDLRIRRFSGPAEKLLSLIPGDVGRPIAYLRNVIGAGDIEKVAAEAVSTNIAHEQRVRCIDGSWHQMTMVPYRTADHAIRGLIIEFTRAPAPTGFVEGGHLGAFGEQLLAALPYAVMLVDRQKLLVWANRAFFESFGVGPAVLGRPLREAWGADHEAESLWGFVEEVASGRESRDVVVEHPFGHASERAIRFSGRLLPAEGDRPELALFTMQEV